MSYDPRAGGATPLALRMARLSHDPRGAFVIRPRESSGNRMNPSMWHLNADTQLSITCEPTHYGEPRDDPDEAERILKTAGHFHISRNLRMSAQTIAACYTEQECMGGRSWTTLHATDDVAKSIALFLNSVYGLLIRIGHGQSTILGRSPIQVRAIPGHPHPRLRRQHRCRQARPRPSRRQL